MSAGDRVLRGEMWMPNPWLMAIVCIGVGVVLWWLTPDMARRSEQLSHFVFGRLSPFRRWPAGMRGYVFRSTRVGALFWIAAGIALLVHTARG